MVGAHGTWARRPVTEQARPTAQGRTAAMLPGARSSRALSDGLGGDVPTTARPRSCDDAGDDRTTLVRALGRGRSVAARGSLAAAGPVAAHGPVPAEPPTVGIAPARLDVRAAADPGASSSPSAGGCGRSGGSTRPTRRNPVPRRRTVAFLGRAAGARVRAAVGHRALRHDAVLGPHGPARPADARRRAAPRPGRADHAAPAGELAARRAGAGSCRSSTRGSSGSWRYPVVAWLIFAAVMWVSHFSPLFDAALEDPLVHDLEHAAVPGAALLFWWPAVALDPAPWRMRHPARLCTSSCRCPRTRSWRS